MSSFASHKLRDNLLMKPAISLTAALLLLLMFPLQAADLKLPSVFSDHMILQRDKPIAVWGWADAGESVTVSFAGQSKSAIAAADGKWSLKLDALAASAEPRTLTATGKDGRKVEVKDVVVGEVWLGSGQSNMEMSVKAANHFDAEQAAANLPLIRYYTDTNSTATKPQAEGKGVLLGAYYEFSPGFLSYGTTVIVTRRAPRGHLELVNREVVRLE